VHARDGRLQVVDITAVDGWTHGQRTEGATQLVVEFQRKGRVVEVTVELTPSGIVTSTRSVASD
jgi:hypothetical protein